jgi:hypothetical protein
MKMDQGDILSLEVRRGEVGVCTGVFERNVASGGKYSQKEVDREATFENAEIWVNFVVWVYL